MKIKFEYMKIDNTQFVKDYWRKLGEHFGYPDCCIEYFCNSERSDDNEQQREIGNLGHGFIPCAACAAKITSGATINELLVNRKHPLPFPACSVRILKELKLL